MDLLSHFVDLWVQLILSLNASLSEIAQVGFQFSEGVDFRVSQKVPSLLHIEFMFVLDDDLARDGVKVLHLLFGLLFFWQVGV